MWKIILTGSNEMADYFNVSNMQDNFSSDNTVTQQILQYVTGRTHVYGFRLVSCYSTLCTLQTSPI